MYIKANKDGIKKVSGEGWRLVYNGNNVMALFEGDSVGYAGGDTQIFLTDTKAKAEAEIKKLGLIIPEHLKEKI
jgi:hypothetical protein